MQTALKMAAPVKDEKRSGYEWLYPDLLSRSDLICVLRQRYVKEPNLDEHEKEYLIELYYKYVIPKPQRKYRLNRRGREMTKKQIIMSKKRKAENPDEDEPPEKKTSTEVSNSRFITSFKEPSTQNRIKPPPSCINFERKKIKLSSSSSSKSGNDSEDTKTKEITNNIKTIKLKNSTDNVSEGNLNKNSSLTLKTTIKMINKHITSSETKTDMKLKDKKSEKESKTDGSTCNKAENVKDREEQKMEVETTTTNPEESPKKKIKIKRISWP